MLLLIFGAILLGVSMALASNDSIAARRIRPALRILSFVFMGLGLLGSCVKQIDAGYVGVKTLFGKVQDDVLPSGLHLINPLLEVRQIDVRTQNYTMSGVHDEGIKSGDDAIRVLTSDGLEVTIDLSVLYRVIPAETPKLLRDIGMDYEDKIVRPITRTRIRDNSVYYEAVALYSTKRDEFQDRIFKTIDNDFKKRGLLLENLLVRNITMPASVKAVIEQKINAEQDAQKMQFVLLKERQEAERKRVEAQGIADYQRIISESLTERQLQYEQIKAMKELSQSQNSKIIVMPSRGGVPVILDAKQ
ncbi:MAG: prohibitin family protein [Chitinophagia bacterium]|nr:prohibitin family protein [Chitinophagia bacterium]